MKAMQITPKPLTGTITPVCSKSIAHRMLICAALCDKPTVLQVSEGVEDLLATIGCLRALGAKIVYTDGLCHITPIGENTPSHAVLDCKESGSTLRFLLPVVAALGVSATFIGHGRLPNRPLDALLEALTSHGVTVSNTSLPLEISGKLTGGTFALPGNISSQYISGLLFALPLLAHDSNIVLTSPLESAGYVRLTLAALSSYGISIAQSKQAYFCSGNQGYVAPAAPYIEADWSAAAFYLAAGALGATITCAELQRESSQSDSAIVNLLKAYGANISWEVDACTISPNTRQPMEVDMQQIPDLLPILAVLAAGAKGKSIFYNAHRLQLKESNRLHAVAEMINNLGGNAAWDTNSLTVIGTGSLVGGTIDSMNDHRIAMAGAIAAILCKKPIIIKDPFAITKSYPDFYEDYKSLGGQLHVI